MYVSLKYTKTCDVILNLLARWKSMIEISFDAVLERWYEEGKVERMPVTPKERIEFIKKYSVGNEAIQKVVPLYIFFKRVPDLPKTRSGEFRKNVNLGIKAGPTRVVNINMEKLGEYYNVIETFIVEVKKILT